MGDRFISVLTNELEWTDGQGLLALPEGIEVKVLAHDPADDDRVDVLVRFPPGYVEPEHTHSGHHVTVVLEGRQIVDGRTLRPGDYLYGPANVPHGPFEYPDGCVVFGSIRGGTLHKSVHSA